MQSSRPLRRWLALRFALVASVPLVVVAILVWLLLLPQMRADISVSHQALARAIAGRVAAHLLGADHALRALADYINAQDFEQSPSWIPLMDAQAGNGDLFEAIYIADENRAVFAVGLPQGRRSKREDLIGLDLSRREFLGEAPLLRKAVWSETFLSTVSSRLAVALAIPMGYRVMVGEISIERLSQFISQLPVEPGLFTTIIDGQGRTIADSRPGFSGRQIDSSIRATLIDEQKTGTSTFEMDGRELLGTVVPVEEVGWKVLVAQQYPDAFRLITITMTMLAASLTIALLLAFAAGWLEARGFSRHFRRYTEQARSIADGDYDQPWPAASISELADLAGNLQRMSDAIRQRENEITASESNLRITLNSIGDAVIATDTGGLVTRLNPIAEQLTGWAAAEAIGKPLSEVFHIVNAYTRQPVESPVDKVLNQGQIVGLANHTVLIARDGTEYQIADSGAPIRQIDGRTVGVVLVFRDVTESYLQTQRIRESEQFLKSLTTNVPGVVYQFYATADRQYGMRYVSEKLAEIFGLDVPHEDLFSSFFANIPNDEKERFWTSMEKAVENESPWQYEGRYLKPNGEMIWFHGSSIPHRKGDEIIFDGFLLDITDLKRAQEELYNSRQMLQLVLDTIPQRVFWKDPSFSYLGCNKAFAGDAGLESPEEIIGKNDFVLTWKDVAELYQNDDRAVMETATAKLNYEEPQTQVDGQVRWLNTSKVPLHDRVGKVIGVLGTYEDITERKKEEIENRKRQFFLESILYHAPDAIVTLDPTHRVIEWNPGAVGMFGYTLEEARGRDLDELVAPGAARAEAVSKTRQVFSSQRVEAFETIRYRKDGTPVHVIAAGSPIMVGNTLTGMVAVYTDISRLKLAEEEARRSETLLRRITDIVPSMIFVKNAEGRFLMANKAVADSLNMRVEDVVGKLHADVHPVPEQVNVMLADDRRALEAGVTIHILEEPYQDSAGETRWLETIKVPCPTSDFGEPAIVGLATDITERKRGENELRRLRNYLANIIDSMPSTLVGVDKDGRVTQWNRHAQVTTGMDAASALGRPLDAVYPLLARKMAQIKETIRSGNVHREQKVPRRDSTETHYEDVVIYPLITNGLEGAVIRVDDVTERVRLEEMMVQSEKMLSVGGLAAGMAHEINNPLAGLLQSAMVLENRLLGDLEANHQAAKAVGTDMESIQAYMKARGLGELLDSIRESGNRAATIVRNMLEFARKSDRAFSSYHLGEVLDQMVELAASDYDLKKNYDFKRIRIIREYSDELPQIPCDKSKIQQVLLNILKNGAQAMAIEGTCDGQPPHFILRTRRDGDMARIEIQDNGPGMNEATRKRVFEPFFTTKPVDRGTGLGLSVSYFIISEDHHGTLTVSSSEGQGTTFVIRLPLTGKDPS